jgi:hypothetical protein
MHHLTLSRHTAQDRRYQHVIALKQLYYSMLRRVVW